MAFYFVSVFAISVNFARPRAVIETTKKKAKINSGNDTSQLSSEIDHEKYIFVL